MEELSTSTDDRRDPRVNVRLGQLVSAYANVYRRVLVYQYPVKEMMSRGWINQTEKFEEIEDELKRFFESDDLADVGFSG